MEVEKFEALLSSNKLVMVDYYADWCGPCRMIAPAVEQISQEYSGELDVHKIDVDQHPEAAKDQEVKSIPTLKFYREGELVDTLIGAVTYKDLKIKIEELTNN